MTDSPQYPLYLFAKAPIPGLVKTRMQPYLSGVESARLAAQLLDQSVEKVFQYWPGKLVLTVTPSTENAKFQALAHDYDIELEGQISGDLGERMLHVLRNGIQRYGGAVVMGCDVPQVTDGILSQTFRSLMAGVNVIGPATDGGFYLLGLTYLSERIFDHVVWGENEVLDQVRRNFKTLDVPLSSLGELRDIDIKEDLFWLAKHDKRYTSFIY